MADKVICAACGKSAEKVEKYGFRVYSGNMWVSPEGWLTVSIHVWRSDTPDLKDLAKFTVDACSRECGCKVLSMPMIGLLAQAASEDKGW